MDLMDALEQVDQQAEAAGMRVSLWDRIRLAFDIIFPPKDRPVALPPGSVLAPSPLPFGLDFTMLAIGGLALWLILRKK